MAIGLSLLWPRFFSPSYSEKFQEAQAYATLARLKASFQGNAPLRLMAPDNDVEDIYGRNEPNSSADLAEDDEPTAAPRSANAESRIACNLLC